MTILLVTKGEVQVTDIGVGILARGNSDLYYNAISGREATGTWIG